MKKMIKVLIVASLIATLVFVSTSMLVNQAYAGDTQTSHFGITSVNGVEMYRDIHGSLLPIWTDKSGKKYVELVINGTKESGAGVLIRVEDMIKADKGLNKIQPKSGSFPEVVWISSPVKWNQAYEYYGGYHSGEWASRFLGNSTKYTIGDSGCFLTSSAMVLATYGLKIGNYLVDPPNLNTWMKNHGGFDGALLKFYVLGSFPGISHTYTIAGNNSSYSNAYMAIYNRHEPVIVFKYSEDHYHFCAFIQTDGVKEHVKINKIVNPYNSNVANIEGIEQTVEQSNLPWWNAVDPQFFVAVPSN